MTEKPFPPINWRDESQIKFVRDWLEEWSPAQGSLDTEDIHCLNHVIDLLFQALDPWEDEIYDSQKIWIKSYSLFKKISIPEINLGAFVDEFTRTVTTKIYGHGTLTSQQLHHDYPHGEYSKVIVHSFTPEPPPPSSCTD